MLNRKIDNSKRILQNRISSTKDSRENRLSFFMPMSRKGSFHKEHAGRAQRCAEKGNQYSKKGFHLSHRLCIAFLFVSSEARLIPIFGMFFYIRVLVAADGIVAPAAVHTGSRPHQPCMEQLHGGIVHIA